ncbi:hypothetical protein CBR_g6359 [Chara braunii]|uniref:Uncharacterized protein n=1 Tax=Chara braunii TaxID=69332 RepID=A0A388KJQ9_CHABU|nr:hypothetical protein CBR_g6359 [Chara braunii]|eukprot:GBG70228.1 hypothetical protein CBR_g6359 [Chara braunii]
MGASTPFSIAAMCRRNDLRHMGFAFAELIFSSLSEEGPTERTSQWTMQRIWEGVFDLDVNALRTYCGEDKEWMDVVSFLDENDGAGWELLTSMIRWDGHEADRLFRSRFFAS